MTKREAADEERLPQERRRFERVEISYAAGVHITDRKGKKLGVLRQIGRGGFMVEPDKRVKVGKKYELTLVEKSENIKRNVAAVVRYADSRFAGFEFIDLDADAAVEIGILIGKYYASELAGVD